MAFTGELWGSIASIYAEILRHPFLVGLTDGSLSRDRFRFYAVQDALYLREFARGFGRFMEGMQARMREAETELAGLARGLDAVVVLMQANPFESALRRRAGAPDGYESLRKTLGAQGARRAPTLLLVNGDTHTFRDDEPLPGLRRVEVFGAPHVRWLRATAVRGGFLIEPGR